MTKHEERDICSMSTWTWRDRLRWRLFPSRYATVPEPKHFTPGDCMVNRTAVYLDWRDRFRVLWSGRLIVQTNTSTENAVGATETTSAAWVVLSWRQDPELAEGIQERGHERA